MSSSPTRPSVVWSGGFEHWVDKGDDVRLFMWEKKRKTGSAHAGTIFFVHGSSMASQPTFDLDVPGRPDSSVMDWFCQRGFRLLDDGQRRLWTVLQASPINFDIPNGAEDLAAGSAHIMSHSGAEKLLVYGISSGALKAALFAQNHPERVARLALDAFVYTGQGSPTLIERAKRLPEFKAMNRRPIDRAFVHSIFTRDHPGCAEDRTVEAFADAILTLDDSMPTGTYVDMTSSCRWSTPRRWTCRPCSWRGEYDGIASFDDLIDFFVKLPNADKQFAVMKGISHAQLPAEKLPDGLSPAAFVFHAARTAVHGSLT